MVERINKLIKEVQSSFGLVSGSQRERSSAQVRWLTGTGQEQTQRTVSETGHWILHQWLSGRGSKSTRIGFRNLALVRQSGQ
ncbi:hypothetical protein [Malikia spinosa]|uniref:hypothetical protein n=1 Tax=Malikia spinosa TaxID=86180 RepID=UPI002FDA03A1